MLYNEKTVVNGGRGDVTPGSVTIPKSLNGREGGITDLNGGSLPPDVNYFTF